MPVAARHQQTPLEFAPPTASETTGAILAYLTLQGFAVWRQNTTGIYDPKTTRYRFNPQGRRGVPPSSAYASDGVLSASKSKPAVTSIVHGVDIVYHIMVIAS